MLYPGYSFLPTGFSDYVTKQRLMQYPAPLRLFPGLFLPSLFTLPCRLFRSSSRGPFGSPFCRFTYRFFLEEWACILAELRVQ